jgi:hypothetical protein
MVLHPLLALGVTALALPWRTAGPNAESSAFLPIRRHFAKGSGSAVSNSEAAAVNDMTPCHQETIMSQEVRGGLVWLARLGYAARGVVYVVVAYFAIRAALGAGQTVGTQEATLEILSQPQGAVLLWIVAIGLLAHSLWRFAQAAADIDGHGTDAKGIAVRAGLAGSGVVNGLLAMFVFGVLGAGLDRFGAGSGGSGGGPDTLQQLLGFQNSQWAVYLVALIPLGVAIAHFIKAWKAKFERHFECREETMRYLRPVARVGLVARGVVFLLIAWLMLLGGSRYEPTDPPGVEETLQAVQGMPAGGWLLLAIGVGLLAFALYSFAEAVWRRINLQPAMRMAWQR